MQRRLTGKIRIRNDARCRLRRQPVRTAHTCHRNNEPLTPVPQRVSNVEEDIPYKLSKGRCQN